MIASPYISRSSASVANSLSSTALANPSATIGLTAVNGTATTALRSDGAQALSQSISPTWSGTHKFTNSAYCHATTGWYVYSNGVFGDANTETVALGKNAAGDAYIDVSAAGTGTYRGFSVNTSAQASLTVTAVGGSVIAGRLSALTTSATDGFLYIPTSAGTPTGVPTAYTGKVALQYDTTNEKLYVYNGAWKSVTLA